ncbi:MAG: PASTA domain-containing protein [Blastocatellia bacterium]|nr:PASTA domain-containing protein [Blastocatellia bacterium]
MRRLLNLGRELSIVVSALVVFVLSASVAMYLVLRQPVVQTPALVGKPLSEAERMAERTGLKLQVKGTVYDERYPAQFIVEQWPPPGMSVKRGQPLRVNVSLGPRPSDRAPSPEAMERKAPGSGERSSSEPASLEAGEAQPHASSPPLTEERPPFASPELKARGEPSEPSPQRRPER